MSQIQIQDLAILLLEPSHTQSKIIESRLAEAGNHNVECVHDTESALKAMQRAAPDLVISSMYLGDMTGSDLVIKMRQDDALSDIPFMLISSENRWEQLDPVKQAGVVAILPKPFEVADLRLALEATAEFIEPDTLETEALDPEDLRVLIVDDSSTSRRHISKLLDNMGVDKITTASNGVEAVQIIDEKLFDIVITDYHMPEMDGAMLTEHIRSHPDQGSIPILMVTSEQNEARLDSVMTMGVSAICDKPFDAGHVRQLLGQLLQ